MKAKTKRALFLFVVSTIVLTAASAVMPDRVDPRAPRQELQTDGSQWTVTVSELGNARLATAVVYPINLYYLKQKTPIKFSGVGVSTGIGAPGSTASWTALSFIAAPGTFIAADGVVLLSIDGASEVPVRTVVSADGRTATAVNPTMLQRVLAAQQVQLKIPLDTGEWFTSTFNVGGLGAYTTL